MKEQRGIEGVEVGDKIQATRKGCFDGYLHCNGGFKIDLTPLVEVREKDGVLYGGNVSLSSFANSYNKIYKPV